MRKLMIVVALTLLATPALAGGTKISHQTEGTYTPRPDIAAEIGAFLIGQVMPLPTPLGAILDHAARHYGTGAQVRQVPAPVVPGKVSH